MNQEAVLAALRDELTCELCDGLFKNPHLFSGCGHTFCFTCIIQRIEGPGIATSQCPKCKQPGWKRDLKPVHVLANIALPICSLLSEAGVQLPTGLQQSTESPRSNPVSAAMRGRRGRVQKGPAAGKQKGSAAAHASKKARVEEVHGSAQKAAAAFKQTGSAAAKAEPGSRLSMKTRASGGRKKVTFAAGPPAHIKAAQVPAPDRALAGPAEHEAEHAHAAKEQDAAPTGAAFKAAEHRAGNLSAAAEKVLTTTGAAPEAAQLPYKPSLVSDTYQELSQPLYELDAGGHISSSSQRESMSAAEVHIAVTASRHSHAGNAAGGRAMPKHGDSKHAAVSAAEAPAAGGTISRPHAGNAAVGPGRAPQNLADDRRAPRWLEETQTPDNMAPPPKPFSRARPKKASVPTPQEGSAAGTAYGMEQATSTDADFVSDCEATDGDSKFRLKGAKTEHSMGLKRSGPDQGLQQRSRKRPKATARQKAEQPTGSARGQGVQKQTAGRCHTRQHRAASDKLFVQQFSAEIHAVLDNGASAGPQPADSHAEAPVRKDSLAKAATAPKKDSAPADSDAEAPAQKKGRGSKARAVLWASPAAGAEPVPSEAAAPVGKESCGFEDTETCRDEAAGAAMEVEAIPETPGAARRATRSASTVAGPAMQEEQTARQTPGGMDTDGNAGQYAGEMHAPAQQQMAQALPEPTTKRLPLSAAPERAEEGVPEQAAGLTPSGRAEALPKHSDLQTAPSAVQEQPGEAAPEQPIEQTSIAAAAEAHLVRSAASRGSPARVTCAAAVAEQGVRAVSSVAGGALPMQATQQTPPAAIAAPPTEDTPSMTAQEQGAASVAPLQQAAGHVPLLAAEAQGRPSRHSAERGAAGISGSEQGAAEAPAMTAEEVRALGQELCARAAQHFPRTQEEAKALRAATTAMREVLQQFVEQAPLLVAELPDSQPLAPEAQRQGLQTGLKQQIDSGVHVDESLPYTMSAAKSLSAIDAALIAKGIRFQSLDVTSSGGAGGSPSMHLWG